MKSLQLILSDRRYFAPVWVFASMNILIGTWVLYIPSIKIKFGLNDAEIGIALFSFSLGSLMAIPFAPMLNKSLGIGRATLLSILLLASSFILPLLAPTYWILCGSLWLAGLFLGFTDVSMNALVSHMEQKDQQFFMSAAHGFFSLGGVVGAGIGALLIGIFSLPAWHMATIAFLLIVSNLYLGGAYFKEGKTTGGGSKSGFQWNQLWPLLGLALFAFIIMGNEGAVEHWSNLYLFDIVGVSEREAGFGFIAFSLCMTIGRFLGDAISRSIGAIDTITYGSIIAFLGYLAILTTNFYLTILGFAIIGIGFSVIVPELFRLAGSTKGVPTSVGVSMVSGIGIIGFLLGPVVLGFISNETSLFYSYVLLASSVILALLILLLNPSR